jgi:hypothetical protein
MISFIASSYNINKATKNYDGQLWPLLTELFENVNNNLCHILYSVYYVIFTPTLHSVRIIGVFKYFKPIPVSSLFSFYIFLLQWEWCLISKLISSSLLQVKRGLKIVMISVLL